MNESSEFVVGSFTQDIIDLRAQSVSGTSDPTDWFVNLIGGQESDSGERVNGWTALTCGHVFQAISILGNSVASLPIEVIETTSEKPRRTTKRPTHVASRLLRDEPHPEFQPSAFKMLMTSWAALYGNGIARIDYFGGAAPQQLTPLLPNSTYLDRDEEGQLWYVHYKDHGGYTSYPDEGSETVWMLPRDVFHIVGPHGGLWGTSLIDVARNSIGQSLALEKHGSSTFKNAAKPSGVLERDSATKPESRRNLRAEWNSMHAGSANVGNVAILSDGWKWKPMSITNDDAQWLEARRFSREEMASWFNLPAHMLNALENSSVRANLEEQNKAFYFHSLRPWLIRWQDEAYRKLFSRTQKRSGRFSVRFNANALVSADFETRMKGHATGRQWGWLSANDVLRIEDMDDIGEQGDIYMVPANMANAETGELFGKPAEPEAPEEDMPEDDQDDESEDGDENDEDGDVATDNSTSEMPRQLNWIRPAMISELTKIVRLEASKVQAAAKRATKDPKYNFCGFLDDFYDNAFVTIACDNLQPICLAASAVSAEVLEVQNTAALYAFESKEFWLSVAQTSTPQTIYTDVTERIAKWSDRAHLAADMILEANSNGHLR